MKIKALDTHLINVIAAGEVIDRPASIVKELVENSLDAQARQIEVEVEGGGVRLIRVSDDGQGVDGDDLALAIKRHTTSKISSEQDLECISTLGFRGEALASICEVARVRLSSRTAAGSRAHTLSVEGGTLRAQDVSGRAPGTTVEVRDLFFNLPARRKFMKSEKTENLHITRALKRFLFSHPQVHLRLSQGGRSVLDSPGSTDLCEVASHLYGAKVAKSLVPVAFEGALLKVHGWVSVPELSRSDRNELYTFVNRRAVNDYVLHYAINRAYEGVLGKGRFPYTCLHLELDPRLLDVNVHPQKREVRFLNPQPVKQDLMRALSGALVCAHATPQLPWKAVESALRYRPDTSTNDLEQRGQQTQDARAHAPASPPKAEPRAVLDPTPVYAAPATKTPTSERPTEPNPTLTSPQEARVVGQLHGTYILVQTPEGFELVDQHVAHERVLYDQFLGQLAKGGMKAQKLLLPETLKLPPDQATLLTEHGPALARLGVEVEPFGAGTFVVRGWPQALAEFHAKQGFQRSVEQLLNLFEQEGEPSFEALAKVLVASLSCEAAVVKHSLLPLEAMRHLVQALRQTRDPFHCPHGRPIILKYDLVELERAFKRR